MATQKFGFWLSLVVGLSLYGSSLQTQETSTADKVHVELYAESLCPFCARFTQQTLTPMFSNGLSEIMDLDIIMYGNARNDSQVSRMHDAR